MKKRADRTTGQKFDATDTPASRAIRAAEKRQRRVLNPFRVVIWLLAIVIIANIIKGF